MRNSFVYCQEGARLNPGPGLLSLSDSPQPGPVMSVVSVVQVVWSHFPVSTLGSVVAAEYAVVQALAVGSVMHSFRGVRSDEREVTRAGRLVEAV